MTTSRVVIETPHVAPSVNSMFATDFKTRRRFPTKKYAAWQQAAAPDFVGKGRVAGHYSMILTIDPRAVRKNSDLSNRIKAVEDLLVKCGVIEDDHLVQRLSALWDMLPNKGMRIEVIPELPVVRASV